MKIDWS
jgi:Leucine-rich repeat (LRR) protein